MWHRKPIPRDLRMFAAFVFFVLFVTSCCQTFVDNTARAPQESDAVETPLQISPPNAEDFNGVDGILIFNEYSETIKANKGLIKLYDPDGTVWKSIDYYKDSTTPKTEQTGDFQPFSFRQSDFDLKFRCTGISRSWFRVVVREGPANEITKYVPVGQGLFRFQSWRDFILGFVSVQFEPRTNPVRVSPNSRRLSRVPENLRFIPVKLKGDWLFIKAVSEDGTGNLRPVNKPSGWIRWREGNQILVSDPDP